MPRRLPPAALAGMRGAGALALAILAGAAACADLRPLEPGTCGNFVVDPGEDCDGEGAGGTCARPGAPDPCRFVCSDEVPCTPGYGCGKDGVCRVASSPPSLVPVREVGFPAPEKLLSGDIDGDGWPDVLAVGEEDGLGRRPARVLYTEPSGPPLVVQAPSLLVAPTLARVSDDPGSSLAFGDLGGVSLFGGTAARRLQLDAFPSVVAPEGSQMRAIPIDALPATPGDEVVVLVGPPGNSVDLAVANEDTVLTTLPGGEEDVAGRIVRAAFDENAPCEQLVFAFRGRGDLLVVRPCKTSGPDVVWNAGGAWAPVALPPGAAVDTGVLPLDLDGDGHLDLLIGASKKLYGAWGKGDGTFQSSPAGGQPGVASLLDTLGPADALEGPPLAAGDLDGDGADDLVLSGGVALRRPEGYVPVLENQGSPWTTALVADFNADGRPDIAAATESLLDVDYLGNAGAGVFNGAFLLTEGPVRHLAAADVDGDLVNDLLVVSAVQQDGETLDELTALRGQAHGPPADRLVVTLLSEVEDIQPARQPVPDDGIDDLILSAEQEDIATDAVFTLLGNGNRAMTAPFPLRADGASSRAVALAAGRFGHAQDDIAALGVAEDGLLRLWKVEVHGFVTLAALEPGPAFEGPFHAAGDSAPFAHGALLAAADLDGDELSEVVVASPYDLGSAVVIARFDPVSLRFVPGAPIPLDAALSSDSSLAVRDVDGDGALDAVLLLREDDVPGEIVVLRGDGQGGLEETPVVIDLGAAAAAFACLSPAGVDRCDLLVLSDEGLFEVIPLEGGGFGSLRVEGAPGGTSLAVADFDRDGVLDVVIGGADGLRYLRSRPVLE